MFIDFVCLCKQNNSFKDPEIKCNLEWGGGGGGGNARIKLKEHV